ncbi:hypothetical protein [Ruminococcus flavefaciens]|uniref:hypothetical protein n=1 Tax=Ruminococcus flavefaciens TaxID=1265 RepID=UPI0026EFF259|nr:hypothetical protein [Ruminococcus flavefaciens]MDD7515909.1 hypothetical protein [Ruminococcus flavefaciens]MDY5691426.1 hypothetical protein [Ruminococcus flavefaciens]
MKVNENYSDGLGRSCLVFSGVRKFSDIYDWLFEHYNGYKFCIVLVKEMFDKVKGHSALAKLNGGSPIPFAGLDVVVFSMDGEAAIVGEGANKPAGDASSGTVTVKPIKFVYQHRIIRLHIRCSRCDQQEKAFLSCRL